MSTPDLHLNTSFILNDRGRIFSTREPGATPGPLFSLVRSRTGCAWAVRTDLPDHVALELERLARQEPPPLDLRDAPVHAERYLSLLAATSERPPFHEIHQGGGPAFTFPDALARPTGIEVVEDEQLLNHNFRGWIPGEIAAGRSPVLAIMEDGYPVSVCFCARRSNIAAEAGLETAEAFRGRGFGPRVTTAWALATRAAGQIPLYSTAWTNTASLAVARKLHLLPYASSWNLY